MVLRFNSEADVLNFKPDVDLLRLKKWFLSVTAPGNKVDFVSRYFGPSTGIDEDAVTGSVHCLLARIWGDILGRKDMTALQLSKRSGLLRLAITNDSRTLRLMGKCFLTVQGTRFLGG
jgi:predicted PhzF superfamily epimerase YddE/YHI9